MTEEEKKALIAKLAESAKSVVEILQKEAKIHSEMRRADLEKIIREKVGDCPWPELEKALVESLLVGYEIGFVDGIVFGAGKGLEIRARQGKMGI